jgi:probable F420-dependent oxidoreductase
MEQGQRSFRFGVIVENVRTGKDLISMARRAEELGYDIILIRDHLVEDPFGHQLAPLAALATVAAVTDTLRIGTLVLANDYRHPAVLAKEAATLDVLSCGRFELGLGAGWLRREYEQAGIPFDPAGRRVGRLEEALRIFKELLAGGSLEFCGEHYRIDGLTNFPEPSQRPRPPILVGGGGKRMLSIAGREADIVSMLTTSVATGEVINDPEERSPETVERKVGWIRRAAGERLKEVELNMIISPIVTDDPIEGAERFARERGWSSIPAEEVLEMPSVFIGSTDRITEQLLARRERYGVSYLVISDGNMEDFAPVVSRLSKT